MNFQEIINTQKDLPEVIFLDAMGTLFGLKESVGTIYGKIAQQFGVNVDFESLNSAFFRSFKASSPLTFPNTDPLEVPRLEKQWWLGIAEESFRKLNVLSQFSHFSQFFDTLYDYFASDQPWFIYQDVMPALEYWQNQGVKLGIISNFDSRLYKLLEELKIEPFFTSVTLSSYTGFAKPHPKIFETALEKHHCLPTQAWHIGDSHHDDYQGAKQLGIQPFLVDINRS